MAGRFDPNAIELGYGDIGTPDIAAAWMAGQALGPAIAAYGREGNATVKPDFSNDRIYGDAPDITSMATYAEQPANLEADRGSMVDALSVWDDYTSDLSAIQDYVPGAP